MSERVLVKDDRDFFSLIGRLTAEQPPVEWQLEPMVQVELPFYHLLVVVDRLPLSQAHVLYQRLENRLAAAMAGS